MKLTIELVPSTSWLNNLRSILSKKDWDTLRRQTYIDAEYKCEVCSGVGSKHLVECHETWSYDDKKKIQKLEGLIALCPKCHMVKHMGFAYIKGNGEKAKNHFIKINKISENKANKYIKDAFSLHHKRSLYDWSVDISFLDTKDICPIV